MKHGFIKVACASPELKVADCNFNAEKIIEVCEKSAEFGAKLLVLPELCITGYTCGDLFFQETLLNGAMQALNNICISTISLDMLIFIGLPVSYKNRLYNCAAVLHKGKVLGFITKTHIPNHGEFYEKRYFSESLDLPENFSNEYFFNIPFGSNIIFTCKNLPALCISAEICEDVWVSCPPSNAHTANGATVIANLSASNETAGKSEYRRQLVQGQSAKTVCAYLYASAGTGESSGDTVFSGHNIIAENGTIIDEAMPFSGGIALSDIDLQHIEHERRRLNTYPQKACGTYIAVDFKLDIETTKLTRQIPCQPFMPSNDSMRSERFETMLLIQSHGLAKRFKHTGSQKAVIGVSGGLDSALALLVVRRAFKIINKPTSDIIAVSMPGFGTTKRTKNNAKELCNLIGAHYMEIDICSQVETHLKDINHSKDLLDITFENAQARIRTLVLMNLANKHNGLVIGTGDLSELALGWATYNGDHISMYGVNSGVLKTLIPHLIRHEAQFIDGILDVLEDIIATPVSPELLPANGEEINQKTEDIVGPYELHDFFLVHVLRWASSPAKILRLANLAFNGKYSEEIIKKWLIVFYKRFFSQQFKRSCLPDGPKVGFISLSPRSDLRMPSDAVARQWLNELENI